MTIQQMLAAAAQHYQAGRLREAEDEYRRALALNENHAEAHHLLGLTLSQQGRHEDAAASIASAIEIEPASASFHGNLGLVLARLGRLDAAIDSYRKSLALKSDDAIVWNNLANALAAIGKLEEAITAGETAVKLRPDYVPALFNFGSTLFAMGRLDEAEINLRRAAALQPGHAVLLRTLGDVLERRGKIEQAAASYRQAVAASPDNALSHHHLALALLRQGKFIEGWREYEWRLKVQGSGIPLADFPQPRWNGEDIKGKRILLYPEQGAGDAMQFVRYVPMIAERGGEVVLAAPPELYRLFKHVEGVKHIYTRGQPRPDFDVHCSLLSLPFVLGTTLETIPAHIPYLHPEALDVDRWQAKLSTCAGPRIGLVWAGSPKHPQDQDRSILFLHFLIFMDPKIGQFFSLQKGEAVRQRHSEDMSLIDHTDDLADFADTAAFISQLDLVISVDTAVAHLAGAMGKPVWLLLPFAPDWRWMSNRTDSPWYPAMRIFRQPQPGDWLPIIIEISNQLKNFRPRPL